MEAIIGIIVGSIVLIIGALFGKWLNRDATQGAVEMSSEKIKDLLMHQEFLKACAEFRNPFLDTKYSLTFGEKKEFGKSLTTLDIVERDFPALEKSYFRFRESLPENDRTTFDDIWHEYICKPHKDDKLQDLFLDYLPIKDRPGLEDRTEEDCKQSALEKIDKLLGFAEP